ncbi:helix-turn-helix domain-containing protein [Nocardia sp. NPDC059246]|uniref:helix-turn-helix domain-containing protein n=1 Tax=unclassified Nocardia TaxID=2637762 RepID=UPI0036BEF652
MALSESEAKVLGALSALGSLETLTVRQICHATKLTETTIHRALLRLSRTGLVVSAPHGPTRWRQTDRGRVAIHQPRYREFVGVQP